MSYKKHRYGSTTIRSEQRDNLSIGWDADVYEPETCSKSRRYPVFLYTPDMRDLNTHYHISLNKQQAKQLKQWLEDYLEDTMAQHKPSTTKRSGNGSHRK